MDPKDVLHALRAGWSWLAAGLVLGLVAAWVVVSTSTPVYTSSSRLFVSGSANDPATAYDANLLPQERVASYAELVGGEAVAALVVDDLDLDLTPAELAQKISVDVIPETVILDVTVTDTSAERAQAIAVSLDRLFAATVAELEAAPGTINLPVRILVVQEPRVESEPISPNVPRDLTLGGALGLLAGFVLLLVRRRADTTIRGPEDVRRVRGARLLGAVVADPRLARAEQSAVDDPRSTSAESFRAIGAVLHSSTADRAPRVLAVTSALAGEGRTTLAVNLAAALSQSGNRVALVEADLRNPSLARVLGVIGTAGVSTVLAGTAQWREVAQHWDHEGGQVTVLAAGPALVRPGEFGSPKMRELLEAVREDHDYVVVDTPPLLAAAEAAVIGALADGCLVATRHGLTRREQLAEALAALARLDARVLGLVLNAVPRSMAIRSGLVVGAAVRPDRRERRDSGPGPFRASGLRPATEPDGGS